MGLTSPHVYILGNATPVMGLVVGADICWATDSSVALTGTSAASTVQWRFKRLCRTHKFALDIMDNTLQVLARALRIVICTRSSIRPEMQWQLRERHCSV